MAISLRLVRVRDVDTMNLMPARAFYGPKNLALFLPFGRHNRRQLAAESGKRFFGDTKQRSFLIIAASTSSGNWTATKIQTNVCPIR